MRPAIVAWGDAHETQGAVELNDWNHHPVATLTCGWVFVDDEAGVSMCLDRWPDKQDEVGTPTFIPRGMIVYVKYID